jgi:hypothetical protein
MAAGRDGNAKDFGKLKLAEKTFDYGKRYGIAATFIFGMARSKFTSQSDFASVRGRYRSGAALGRGVREWPAFGLATNSQP